MCCVLCQGKLGELLISLCYQPAPGLINVGIVAARSLKAKDLNGRSGVIHTFSTLKCFVVFKALQNNSSTLLL